MPVIVFMGVRISRTHQATVTAVDIPFDKGDLRQMLAGASGNATLST